MSEYLTKLDQQANILRNDRIIAGIELAAAIGSAALGELLRRYGKSLETSENRYTRAVSIPLQIIGCATETIDLVHALAPVKKLWNNALDTLDNNYDREVERNAVARAASTTALVTEVRAQQEASV